MQRYLEANTQRTIYINVEQSPKPMRPGELDQSRIDAAFRRPPRLTRNRAQVEDYTYCLLSGKNTNMLEVRNDNVPGITDPIKVTSLERTLVDIVVRPAYSGGTRSILEAYRRAAGKIDIQRLASTFDQLHYVYPYHQAIGFFMGLSQCYSKEQLDIIRKYPKKFDFYADYEISEPKYSAEWRIYYPSYLDRGSD